VRDFLTRNKTKNNKNKQHKVPDAAKERPKKRRIRKFMRRERTKNRRRGEGQEGN
jgi:hypothetical protein